MLYGEHITYRPSNLSYYKTIMEEMFYANICNHHLAMSYGNMLSMHKACKAIICTMLHENAYSVMLLA